MCAKKVTELDVPLYLFHQGNNARSYEFLGAHITEKGRKKALPFVFGHRMPPQSPFPAAGTVGAPPPTLWKR